MNKENSRGAAGLRRSAIAERIRLREEWSALKEVDTATTSRQTDQVLTKKPGNARCTPSASSRNKPPSASSRKKNNPKSMQESSDALRGVVALVDVGAESRALPLRCALAAMGATVVINWSPLVTHLIWNDNGCRATRAKARALACKLVSPLWVEACAAAACKLSERAFPAACRQSDLPSPRTLKQLLKKAEMDGIPLVDLLSDSKDDNDGRPRLRISSETDTSRDKTADTSEDTIELESRVNTAPRRGAAEPASRAPPPPKSRRKLFTHKEADDISSSDDETDADATKKNLQQSKLTQRERKDLARAERMAKKLLAACNTQRNNNNDHVAIHASQNQLKPKIVLTGMSRLERRAITKSIQKLDGVVQKCVNKRTTHVLLGSCRNKVGCSNHPSNITGVATHCDLSKSGCWSDATDKRARTCNALQGAARGCRVLHARWAIESAAAGKWLHHVGYEVEHLRKICQKARVERTALGRLNAEYAYDVFYGMRVHLKQDADQREPAKQLLTLCGASVDNDKPTNCLSSRPHINNSHTIPNNILTTNNNGLRTQINVLSGRPTPNIAANGQQTQNSILTGRPTQRAGQNGQKSSSDHQYDVVIGSGVGEVNSKWVFDSVTAARMRTTRRYVNMNSLSDFNDDVMNDR